MRETRPKGSWVFETATEATGAPDPSSRAGLQGAGISVGSAGEVGFVPMADTNRQWILVRRPSGPITDDCFELRESPVPEPADGQFLVQNEYLSCDPAQRGWMAVDTYIPKIPLGEVVRARGVGKVVASRHPDFAVGDLVWGSFGWQEYCVSDGGGLSGTRRLPPGLPLDLALSVFGSTGITAYFGMIEVARVKEGDVVLVSGAAGATGSIAAQIARVKGARVIGIAGGPRKKEFLLKVLKLDDAIDYKNEDVDVRIAELAPKGLDIYFDNVGGKILEAAIAHLALGARIALCGAISGYEDLSAMKGPANYLNLILTRSTMQGFLMPDFLDRATECVADLARWIEEGKLVNQIDVVEGIENTPAAFKRLFTGENFGKQIVRLR